MKKHLALLLIPLLLSCGGDESSIKKQHAVSYEIIEFTDLGQLDSSCRKDACSQPAKGEWELFFYTGSTNIEYWSAEDVDRIEIYRVTTATETKTLIKDWTPENIQSCQPAGCFTNYDEIRFVDRYSTGD